MINLSFPNTGYLDRTITNNVTWTITGSPSTSFSQTAFEPMYRIGTGSWNTLGKTTSSTKSYNLSTLYNSVGNSYKYDFQELEFRILVWYETVTNDPLITNGRSQGKEYSKSYYIAFHGNQIKTIYEKVSNGYNTYPVFSTFYGYSGQRTLKVRTSSSQVGSAALIYSASNPLAGHLHTRDSSSTYAWIGKSTGNFTGITTYNYNNSYFYGTQYIPYYQYYTYYQTRYSINTYNQVRYSVVTNYNYKYSYKYYYTTYYQIHSYYYYTTQYLNSNAFKIPASYYTYRAIMEIGGYTGYRQNVYIRVYHYMYNKGGFLNNYYYNKQTNNSTYYNNNYVYKNYNYPSGAYINTVVYNYYYRNLYAVYYYYLKYYRYTYYNHEFRAGINIHMIQSYAYSYQRVLFYLQQTYKYITIYSPSSTSLYSYVNTYYTYSTYYTPYYTYSTYYTSYSYNTYRYYSLTYNYYKYT